MSQEMKHEEANVHATRIAKVVELVASSSKGFEDAVQNAVKDASETMRGISGCEVDGFNVKCKDGAITEYRVNVKLAFGIER